MDIFLRQDFMVFLNYAQNVRKFDVNIGLGFARTAISLISKSLP
jgi:hypothetical protein